MSLQIFVGIPLLPGNKFQLNYICFNDCNTIWKGPIIRFQGFSQFVVRYQLSALQLTRNLLNNNNFDSLIWFCKKYLISPKYPWKSLWKTINHNMHYAQNTSHFFVFVMFILIYWIHWKYFSNFCIHLVMKTVKYTLFSRSRNKNSLTVTDKIYLLPDPVRK